LSSDLRRGRQEARPIGIPIVNDERYNASWSEDNLLELNKGWIKKGNSLEDIAGQIDVIRKFSSPVERWNELCQNGQDDDHKRPPKTMMPIANRPSTSWRLGRS